MDAGAETITITVIINGTSVNRWHRMGLTQNPFPQIAKAEYNRAEQQINSLDGDPITGPGDIRHRLRGFSEEFIEGCVERYTPGERTRFEVTWPVS